MAEDRVDPLLLGQRVVAILETGLRTATYKLATLMALIDQCIENLPDDPAKPLTVPIPDLARRVLEIYWRQVRPFDGHELRQSTQSRARILLAANALRAAADGDARGVSVDIAALRSVRLSLVGQQIPVEQPPGMVFETGFRETDPAVFPDP